MAGPQLRLPAPTACDFQRQRQSLKRPKICPRLLAQKVSVVNFQPGTYLAPQIASARHCCFRLHQLPVAAVAGYRTAWLDTGDTCSLPGPETRALKSSCRQGRARSEGPGGSCRPPSSFWGPLAILGSFPCKVAHCGSRWARIPGTFLNLVCPSTRPHHLLGKRNSSFPSRPGGPLPGHGSPGSRPLGCPLRLSLCPSFPPPRPCRNTPLSALRSLDPSTGPSAECLPRSR